MNISDTQYSPFFNHLDLSSNHSTDMAQDLPLDGIKVVELTLAIAGPSAGSTLADYGADVVKIEPPTGPSRNQLTVCS